MGFSVKKATGQARRAGERLVDLLKADPLDRPAIEAALAFALEQYDVLGARWDKVTEAKGSEIAGEAGRVHQELSRLTTDGLCGTKNDSREDAADLVADFARRANSLFPGN